MNIVKKILNNREFHMHPNYTKLQRSIDQYRTAEVHSYKALIRYDSRSYRIHVL